MSSDEDTIDPALEAALYSMVYHEWSFALIDPSRSQSTQHPQPLTTPLLVEPIVDGLVTVDFDCSDNNSNSDSDYYSHCPSTARECVTSSLSTNLSTRLESNASNHFQPSSSYVSEQSIRFCFSKETDLLSRYDISKIQKCLQKDETLWQVDPNDVILARHGRRYMNERTVKCRRCHDVGHHVRDCKRPSRPPCLWCGTLDHGTKSCSLKICGLCFGDGHISVECLKTKTLKRKRNKLVCDSCRLYGHPDNFCPDFWRRYRSVQLDRIDDVKQEKETSYNNEIVSCYNCGSSGHIGYSCPMKTQDSRITRNCPWPSNKKIRKNRCRAYDFDNIEPFNYQDNKRQTGNISKNKVVKTKRKAVVSVEIERIVRGNNWSKLKQSLNEKQLHSTSTVIRSKPRRKRVKKKKVENDDSMLSSSVHFNSKMLDSVFNCDINNSYSWNNNCDNSQNVCSGWN